MSTVNTANDIMEPLKDLDTERIHDLVEALNTIDPGALHNIAATINNVGINLSLVNPPVDDQQSGETGHTHDQDTQSYWIKLRDQICTILANSAHSVMGDLVKLMFDRIISTLKKMGPYLGALLFVCGLLAARSDRAIMGSILCGIGIMLLYTTVQLKDLKDSLLSLFDNWFDFRPRAETGADEDKDPQSSVKAFIKKSLLIVMTCLGFNGKSYSLSKMFDKILNFTRGADVLESIWSVATAIFQDIYDYVRPTFGLKERTFWSSGLEKLHDWIKEVKTLEKKIIDRTFEFNESSLIYVQVLFEDGEQFLDILLKHNGDEGSKYRLKTYLRFLQNLKMDFAAMAITTDGTRQEPVCVFIKGEPGVGKSMMVKNIHAAFLAMLPEGEVSADSKTNPEKYLFNRQNENVYWEGYNDRCITTVIDDFGQVRDTANTRDSSYMEVIRMVNEFPYHIHMANMKDKACARFNSKLVILTSNLFEFHPESICNVDAFKRRLHIIVEQRVNDAYCTNGVRDDAKLDIENGVTVFDDRHVHYVLCDKNGVAQPGQYSLLDLMELIREKYEFKKQVFQSTKGRVQTIMKDFRELRNPQVVDQIDGFDYKDYIPDPDRMSAAAHATWETCKGHMNSARRAFNNLSHEVKEKIKDYYYFDIHGVPRESYMALLEPPHIRACQQLINVCADEYIMERIGIDMEELTTLVLFMDTAEVQFLFDAAYTVYRRRVLEASQNPTLFLLSVYSCCTAKLYNQDNIPTVTFVDYLLKIVVSGGDAVPNCKPLRWTWYDRWLHTPYFLMVTQPLEDFGDLVNQTDNLTHESRNIHWIMRLIMYVTSLSAFVVSSVVAYSLAKAFLTLIKDGIYGVIGWLMTWYTGSKPPDEFEMGTPADCGFPTISPGVTAQISTGAVEATDRLIYETICKENMYSLSLLSKDKEWKQVGTVFFVFGRVFVIPWHFLMKMTEMYKDADPGAVNVRLKKSSPRGQQTNIIECGYREIIEQVIVPKNVVQRDFAFVHLKDTKYQEHRKMIDFFVSAKDREIVIRGAAILVGTNQGFNTMRLPKVRSLDVLTVVDDSSKEQKRTDLFEYEAATRLGDCGSILFSYNNDSRKGVICGMHIAGAPGLGRGYAAAFTKEEVQEIFDEYVKLGMQEPPEPGKMLDAKGGLVIPQEDVRVSRIDAGSFEKQGSHFSGIPDKFSILGQVSHGSPSGNKSHITPSSLYDIFEGSYDMFHDVSEKPARLRPFNDEEGKLVDPYLEAIDRYTAKTTQLPLVPLEAAVHDVETNLISCSTIEVERRPYSFEEAIDGVKDARGEELMSPIERSTSAGYPYTAYYSPRRAKDVVLPRSTSGHTDYGDPEIKKLKKRVETVVADARKGKRHLHLFTDFLKDERVSFKKYKIGKTRLVSGSPIDYTLACRMYFGAFAAWLMRNRIYNGCAVGINPFSFEWDVLARKLNKYGSGENIGAGDYSGFDCGHHPTVLWAILRLINRWYNDEHSNVRIVLWLDLMYSNHVRGDVAYTWTGGLPSGHMLTSFVNSLYNLILLSTAWRIIVDLAGLSLSFYKHVYVIVYGDDNVFCVDPRYTYLYNELSISRVLAEYGVVYTSDVKDAEVLSKMRSLAEVSFLKRRFIYSPDAARYIAPLHLNTIMQMIRWTKKGCDSDAITVANVHNAFRELSLHGRENYLRYGIYIFKHAAKQYPEEIDFRTYDDEFDATLRHIEKWQKG